MLKRIAIIVCDDCLNGIGQECHTPGCALFLHKVDLPIDPMLYEVLEEASQPAAPEKAKCDCEKFRAKGLGASCYICEPDQ